MKEHKDEKGWDGEGMKNKEQLSSSTDMDGCKGSVTRVIGVTVGFYSKLSAMKVSV